MRGIVISPVEITGKNSMVIKGLNPIKLRQYLLYWDKIDFPKNNLIGFGESPDIEFLKQVGVLKQTNVQVLLSGEMTELYLKGQIIALNKNNEAEKGCWSLGQTNTHLVLPKNDTVKKRNIEINLHQALPIPSDKVSLDDILYFKERRKDELLSFRGMMDELYLEVADSSDQDRAEIKNIEKLQRSLMDLHKVMDESFSHRLLGGLKVEIDVPNLFDAAIKTAKGAGAGAVFHFPVEYGAILGLASSFIKVSSEVSLRPKAIPDNLRDFAYLYYAEKELQ
ncbi:DUF6236 family protein [Terrilactibacillus laevilacticus]|uniref:DUF6236 family protein n=1 Tax=Terrilactibacillus laevilacticus TaxID=1380157 RepID=A0ABW5PME8_9BACI|nr:DUF6236 family protein [Terrilactibacillus laevilacticus]